MYHGSLKQNRIGRLSETTELSMEEIHRHVRQFVRCTRNLWRQCRIMGWIGRDGPIPWPPRSPDITPLDFFLWGYVKDIVYRTKIRDITDLKQKITDVIATIDEAMLQRIWQEIEYHLDVLRATNGAHIQ